MPATHKEIASAFGAMKKLIGRNDLKLVERGQGAYVITAGAWYPFGPNSHQGNSMLEYIEFATDALIMANVARKNQEEMEKI